MVRGRRFLRENVTNCHHYFCPTQGRRGEEIGKLFFCIFIVFLLLYFWSCEISLWRKVNVIKQQSLIFLLPPMELLNKNLYVNTYFNQEVCLKFEELQGVNLAMLSFPMSPSFSRENQKPNRNLYLLCSDFLILMC